MMLLVLLLTLLLLSLLRVVRRSPIELASSRLEFETLGRWGHYGTRIAGEESGLLFL